MLHEFLSVNRLELIDRCRLKVAQRAIPKCTQEELEYGIPLFLDQLIKTLRVEQTRDPMQSRRVSGPSGGGKPVLSEIGESAARHGQELLQGGFSIDQVVHGNRLDKEPDDGSKKARRHYCRVTTLSLDAITKFRPIVVLD